MSHGKKQKCRNCSGTGFTKVKAKSSWKWNLLFNRPDPLLEKEKDEVCKVCFGIGKI